MFDLIYNFILNVLLGNSESANAQSVAELLTFVSIVMIFFALVKLVIWAFNLGSNNKKWRS